MGTVRYTNINGRIVAEKRNGVRRLYVPDAIGSTTAMVENGTVTSEFKYWPYGEVRSGTDPTPFQFCGTLGYRQDNRTRLYVRARPYQPCVGRWATADPLPANSSGHQYLAGLPTRLTDPSGLTPGSCADCAAAIRRKWMNSNCQHEFNHPYAHCMGCCLLSQYGGASCASVLQLSQITWIKVREGGKGNDMRESGCASGIAASEAGATGQAACEIACTVAWPNANPPNPYYGKNITKGGALWTRCQGKTGPFPPIGSGCNPPCQLPPYLPPNVLYPRQPE